MNKKKLLVADDDVFFQELIGGLLAPDYEVIVVQDGTEAWHQFQQPDAPRLAVLDWVMPGLSGPQICRKVRASESLSSTYLILLTARNNESDIIAGLSAGADDYITKPPIPAELRARIKMGERVLSLQDAVKSQALTSSNRISERGSFVDVSSSLRLCAPLTRQDNQCDASCEIALGQRSELVKSTGDLTSEKRGPRHWREYSLGNYHSKQ